MTKFFVQLLLSAIVSVSAAVGFNPNAREKIHETWSEAKTIVRETTQFVFEAASGIEIEADTSADAWADTPAQAELDTEVEAETEVEAAIENAALEVESELESDVDLDLGLGK